MYDVIIVGGGVAGLTAAYRLQQAGLKPLVLESQSYPGGRIRTIKYDALYAEAGASVVTEGEDQTLNLLKELGIGPLITLGQHGLELFLHERVVQLTRMDGRIARLKDLWSLLRLFLVNRLSRDGSLPLLGPRLYFSYRRALQQIEKESKRITFPYQPAESTGWDSETFAAFLDRFHPDLRHYVDLQLKVTAGELADRISLFWGLVTFHWNVDGRFYWISGGTGSLPQALADRLGSALCLESVVHGVTQSVSGKNMVVQFSRDGRLSEVDAKTVIIATPPHATLQFLKALEPWKREALESVQFGAYVVVHLLCKTRFWEQHIGTGYLNCAGVVFADLLDGTKGQPGSQGILTCFLAGQEARNYLNASDEIIYETVFRDLEKVFPHKENEVLTRQIFRWSHAIPYFPPHYSGTLSSLRKPQGNLFFCGDYTQGAGINDAVVSGQIAAQDVLEFLTSTQDNSPHLRSPS